MFRYSEKQGHVCEDGVATDIVHRQMFDLVNKNKCGCKINMKKKRSDQIVPAGRNEHKASYKKINKDFNSEISSL